VVPVCDDQDLARFGQLGMLEDQRARAGERQRQDALQRALEQRAVRHLQEAFVEGFVQRDVALERLVVGAAYERLDRLVDRAQCPQVAAAGAALGGVRETPRRSTSRSSDMRSPGLNSPLSSCSRRLSSARVIWVRLA